MRTTPRAHSRHAHFRTHNSPTYPPPLPLRLPPPRVQFDVAGGALDMGRGGEGRTWRCATAAGRQRQAAPGTPPLGFRLPSLLWLISDRACAAVVGRSATLLAATLCPLCVWLRSLLPLASSLSPIVPPPLPFTTLTLAFFLVAWCGGWRREQKVQHGQLTQCEQQLLEKGSSGCRALLHDLKARPHASPLCHRLSPLPRLFLHVPVHPSPRAPCLPSPVRGSSCAAPRCSCARPRSRMHERAPKKLSCCACHGIVVCAPWHCGVGVRMCAWWQEEDHLSRMYCLCCRIPNGLQPIATIFRHDGMSFPRLHV
ncbi:unnamed protein product [Closterium sp. Naga37s-1]|nr:unnamed protein product [Closterium sp. Naga37s-1]